MYKVLLESGAEKDLRRLPAEVFTQIIPRLKDLANDPRPPGCRKLAGSNNDWRLRVGNYRILYEIADEQKEIRIMRVRHRRVAYR